jgi:hypothetical protein
VQNEELPPVAEAAGDSLTPTRIERVSVYSPVEPGIRRRIHLVQLMQDRVRGLVGEVVDDILRIRSSEHNIN